MTTVARGNHILAKPAAAIPSFMPSAIAWYKWGEGIEITGSGVSQWDDQSGNGNHLTQGTDTNRPALQADRSILFDGVDNYLKTSAFTLNQPETIYFLGKQITWTSGDTFFDGNALNSGRLYQTYATPRVDMYAGANGPLTTGWVLNTFSALCCVYNGANSTIQVNTGSPQTGNPGAANMGGFTLGTRGDLAGQWSHFNVKEVIIFPQAHTASQRLQMLGYLMLLGQV